MISENIFVPRWGGANLHEVYLKIQRPFYIYDLEQLVSGLQNLQTGLPKNIGIKYAIKSNSHPRILEALAPHIQGFDVTSTLELERALNALKDPRQISFAGPGKELSEIESVLKSGAILTIESFSEIESCSQISRKLGVPANVCLRINPPFELKGSGMRMSGGAKQFGIDSEEISRAIELCQARGLDIRALQVFSGSQCLSHESIIDAQKQAYSLIEGLMLHHQLTLDFINLGGGFGVPYFENEQPLEIEPIKKNMNELATMAQKFPCLKLVFELGRFISAECGLYVCRVLDVKVSRGKTFIVTNGGFHHHLAAAGLLGQVIRKSFPIKNLTKSSGNLPTTPQSVVGCLCTPLDVFADNLNLPKTEIGDLMGIFQSGAYGRTASPVDFLSHPHPAEVFTQKGIWYE